MDNQQHDHLIATQIKRRETAGVRDGSWLGDVIATDAPRHWE